MPKITQPSSPGPQPRPHYLPPPTAAKNTEASGFLQVSTQATALHALSSVFMDEFTPSLGLPPPLRNVKSGPIKLGR